MCLSTPAIRSDVACQDVLYIDDNGVATRRRRLTIAKADGITPYRLQHHPQHKQIRIFTMVVVSSTRLVIYVYNSADPFYVL
jgi:hypothetical protein